MVERLTTELVVPAEEMPACAIWLSNLDLAARRGYTPTVYFYPTNNKPDFFEIDAVKDSLARALVVFYPLAGRLGVDAATGRIQIDCMAQGAVFVTARSEYVLDELLNEFVPCDEMRDLLVPATPAPNPPCPLLFVQVTRLHCGGVVLGLALHHSVVDGRSATHFRETWAMLARGGGTRDNVPLPPCFDHRLLSARPPATRTVTYDHLEYKPEPSPVDAVAAGSAYTSAIIMLSKAQVTALKARCPGASMFRAVVALVWQCVCHARALPPETETRLYSMIDMRSRLDPSLPPGYFGNAVVRTSVSARVREVVGNPVGYVAHCVQAATSQGDDYARSLVDYLEDVDAMNLPRSGISRAHLRAISWMGMSLHNFDFGWGAPVFRCPALMCYSGFMYVMLAPGNDGAVALAMSLESESMPEFRKVFAQELASLRTMLPCKI